MEVTYQNLNQALIGLSCIALDKGVRRRTRGYDCIEIPEPVLVKITNPSDRYVNIPERKWNKVFGFIESLWIASGTNHMELVNAYIKNMSNFSDDGQFMRAAYGPRVRAFTGIANDYKISNPVHRNVFSGNTTTVDQLEFVVQILRKDINSRQALINIHDPAKDTFDGDKLKVTKDMPCCRTLQFMVVDGKLDCTLTIRSNDIIWGFSAVNLFNFTFIQEYVAAMLNVPVGNYYHFANNLHFYDDKIDLIEQLSILDPDLYGSENTGLQPFYYGQYIPFEIFDFNVNRLFMNEVNLREKGEEIYDRNEFEYDFFKDWATVFYNYWNKSGVKDKFINPYLNNLFNL